MSEAFPAGHYYSVVPSSEDVSRALFGVDQQDITSIGGIDLRVEQQWLNAQRVGKAATGIPLVERATAGRRYGYQDADSMYNRADAAVLTAMIGWSRPARILEIGSGYSTACSLDAATSLGLRTQITAIEPFPDRLKAVLGDSLEDIELVVAPVQDVGVDSVRSLTRGDILFIDSTHVAKLGSDVLFELFHLLPVVRPGVLVHVHDIFPGFEYPPEWTREGRYWNEAYMLRAFLQYNSSFRVELWPTLLGFLDHPRLNRALPDMGGMLGGSLWLKRMS
jgi:predicted O-methyltransferase YrrM